MKALAAIALVFTVACATLTPAGQKVRVTSNSEAVRGCRYLGAVLGADHAGVPQDKFVVNLKNNGAKLGANVVLITAGTWQGEAYACPAASAETPPAAR